MCMSLHAIGFACELTPVTSQFVAQAVRRASIMVPCAQGNYHIWKSHRGAEIWFHYPTPDARQRKADAKADASPSFDPIDDLKGITVSHRGLSSIVMRLAHSTPNSSRNPLEGVCVGTLEARRGKGRPTLFSFEHIGHALDPFIKPITARVQVIGLAHKIWAYPTEDQLMRAMPDKRLIGRGALMAVTPGEVREVNLVYRSKPNTLWLCTGLVKRSMRLVNPETQQPYVWLLLDTERGDIDLLASPDVIEGDISTGHMLQAVVSMAGRVLERLS